MKIVRQPKLKPQGLRWTTVFLSCVLGSALIVLALIQGAHKLGLLEKAEIIMKEIRGTEQVYNGSTYHNFTMPMPKFKEDTAKQDEIVAQANSI